MALLGTAAVMVLAIAGIAQALALTKDERVMLRSHSEACLPESRADPRLVADLLKGVIIDDPALRKHVHCVLLKCKMMTKEGKLHKPAVFGKFSKISGSGAASKAAEACAEPVGDTPEEIAWNFFKCGLEKSAPFVSMGAGGASAKNAEAAKISGDNIERKASMGPASGSLTRK